MTSLLVVRGRLRPLVSGLGPQRSAVTLEWHVGLGHDVAHEVVALVSAASEARGLGAFWVAFVSSGLATVAGAVGSLPVSPAKGLGGAAPLIYQHATAERDRGIADAVDRMMVQEAASGEPARPRLGTNWARSPPGVGVCEVRSCVAGL